MKIAVQNLSTVLTDAEVSRIVSALQTQVSRDFAPIWNAGASLCFLSASAAVPVDHALLGVFDDADQAGALGYHDVTSSDMPIGKAFARTAQQFGALPSVTISHELLEMLADPQINLCALRDSLGRFYAVEVCDAVEDDSLGYDIDGVRVSDFVTPAWFDERAPIDGRRFSFGGHVSAPYELAAGGYISWTDGSGWTQDTAQHGRTARQMHDAHARRGSRRERRSRGRTSWLRSESP